MLCPFLSNHAKDIASIDCFIVPTVTFRVLFVFMIVSDRRRRVVHFNVTESPFAWWTGQQLIEAYPLETAPKYLLRDRGAIYGLGSTPRVRGMGTEEVVISARPPWQNPYVERLIGSIRREWLDHVIIFSEGQRRRTLKEYFRYYHRSCTHPGLEKDCPEPRPVEPPRQESGHSRA